MKNSTKLITSRIHDDVKAVVALHEVKGRRKNNLFIAQGTRTCAALVEGGYNLKQLYITEHLFEKYKAIIKTPHITTVTPEVMEKMSTTENPSGYLGVFGIPATQSYESLEGGLVLAQISDPGNMGTLIRTAAAMKVPCLVAIDSADIWSPKVVQASAGSLAQLRIFTMRFEDLVAHKKNIPLNALVVSGGKNPHELDLKNSLLMVGNEAHGIPQAWISHCDNQVTLPMPGNTESLNAAVAGSIALYLAWAPK